MRLVNGVVCSVVSLVMLVGTFVPVGWAQEGDEIAVPPAEEQAPIWPSEPVAAAEPAPSETPEEPVSYSEDSFQPSPEPAPETTAVTPSPEGTISVDFKDADIRQVLRVISLKSGVDVIAGPDVEGLITIKLTNVPWEEALSIILRTYGLAYERKGNIVRVMTQAAVEQEALATEVFPLDYAKAKDVPDVIAEMLSDRGKVKYDERTNTVIVTDIPTNVFQIKEVIDRIDRRTPQVLIEAKVIETRLTKEENLGIDWSTSLSLTQSIPSINNTFPYLAGTGFGKVGEIFGTQRVPEQRTTTAITLGTLDPGDLTATLNYLQTRTETEIVSNPTIVALDNQEAKIHIGLEYPVPNYTLDQTTGRVSISGYTSKQTGTILTVTPHVNPSLEVVVDLKPEVIAVGDAVTYNLGTTSGSISFPQFTTQTAKTQVRVQNGQTIAIGGLVKTSKSKVAEKIPVLGDIPLLGVFFKNTRWYSGGSDPNKQDLLIFLTVKLTEEDQQKQDATVAAAPPNSMSGY